MKAQTLKDTIIAKKSQTRTDSYAMSIGELTNLYESDEIDIHPEFQRIYRWTDGQKSRLIESILLGIPIPPIFVAQSDEGYWDVVDGVQRLSTILQLQGILRSDEGERLPPLVLQQTKLLPLLKNHVWDLDQFEESERETLTEIPVSIKLDIKRSRFDIIIVQKESDPRSKYELFQRLNTGGSHLSDQEVRNCVLIMENKSYFEKLKTIASNDDFRKIIGLTSRQLSEQYDMELALRFVLMREIDPNQLLGIGSDVAEFFTDLALEKLPTVDWDLEEDAFRQTFNFLAGIGENVTRKYNVDKDSFEGQFLISLFECICLGVGYHILSPRFHLSNQDVLEIAKALHTNEDFVQKSGSGVKADQRLPHLIPLGRRLVEERL